MPADVTVKQEPGCLEDGASGPATCMPTHAPLDVGPVVGLRALRTPEKIEDKMEMGADSGHSSPAQHSAADSVDSCAGGAAVVLRKGSSDHRFIGTELGYKAVYDEDDDLSSDALSEGGEDEDEPIDDDFGELTSLAWLQNANLLRNVGGGGEPRGHRVPRQSSPLAVGGRPVAPNQGLPSQVTRSCAGGSVPAAIVTPGLRQHTLSGGADGKPPYSFSCLIFMAIEESPSRRLPVKDIYGWIARNFPYYQSAPPGWRNSVRHNLSLNKCFKKIDRDEYRSSGKGACWCVDPLYRPNLLQALRRSPYVSHHQMQIMSLASTLSQLSKKLMDEACDVDTKCLPPRMDIEAANALVSLRMPSFKREASPSASAPQVDVQSRQLSSVPLGGGGAYDATPVGEHGGRKRKHCDSEPSAVVTAAAKALAVVTEVPSLDHTYVASSASSAAMAESRRVERLSSSDSSAADDDEDHLRFRHRDDVASRSNSEEASSSDGEPAKRKSAAPALPPAPPAAPVASTVHTRQARHRMERNRRVLQAYGRATLAVAGRGGGGRKRQPKSSEADAGSAAGGDTSRSLLSLASAASLAMMDVGLGRPVA